MTETPFERRQRQEAERIMRRASPQAEMVMNELATQQRYAIQIGDVPVGAIAHGSKVR
jgi:hypothetical protein